jgi:diguanylate cyclase (GGDEF)-like protein
VVFVDIDDFKILNDRFGHLEGDFALKRIADILGKAVRKSDIMSRWGGE